VSAPAFLLDYARVAEPRLRAFLESKRRAFEASPVDLRDAYALLSDYVLRGGKRLRGALVLVGNRAAGGTDSEAALDASIGVELLHAYLLIHDDFMDRDELRRGGPTLHRALGGDHLGNSLAVLLGSLCQAWAYELVLRHGDAGAAAAITRTLEEVTLGQMADLRAPAGAALGEEQILELERLKTGSYTFDLPLRIGASRAPAALLDALSAYALPLGQAFQIADDLLGTFGAPEVTGKPSGSDLREGKRTLLVARALERASPADQAALREGLGRDGADVDGLRAILRRSGAEQECRADAQRLRAQALAALGTVQFPATVREDLEQIATYAVGRAL
jgi:geranylgeranyl diphosphate synthase type I